MLVAGVENVARDGEVAFWFGVEWEGGLFGLGDVDVVWGLRAEGECSRCGGEGSETAIES